MATYVFSRYFILFQGLYIFYLVNSQTTSQFNDVTPTSGNVTCQTNETLCNDGKKCFRPSYECDGISDCDDGSDELNCVTLPPVCPEQLKRCPDGSCVQPFHQCAVISINITSSQNVSDTTPESTLMFVASLNSSSELESSGVHFATQSFVTDVTSFPVIIETSSVKTIGDQSTTVALNTAGLSDSLLSGAPSSSADDIHTTSISNNAILMTSLMTESLRSSSNEVESSSVYSRFSHELTSLANNVTSRKAISLTPSQESPYLHTSSSFSFLSHSTPFDSSSVSSTELIFFSNSSILQKTTDITFNGTLTPTATNIFPTEVLTSVQTRPVVYNSSLESSTYLTSEINIIQPTTDETVSLYTTSQNTSSAVILETQSLPKTTQESPLMTSYLDISETMTQQSVEESFLSSSPTTATSTISLDTSPFPELSSVIQSTTSSEIVSSTLFSSVIQSVAFTSPFNKTSTLAPPTEKLLPPWLIAVIVCGCVVFLYLLFLIYVLCKRRHKLTKYKMSTEDPDDIGYRRSLVKRPGHEYVSYENRLYYEPDTPEQNGGDSENNPFSFRSLKNSDFRKNDV